MNKCNYLKGKCQIQPNEIMIWDVNKDQNCKFPSIGKFNGYFNENFWINNENQIALILKRKYLDDCGNHLQLTSEGFALREIDDDRFATISGGNKSVDYTVKSTNYRLKRQSYVFSFQEAGEFQYLENNLENQMKRFMETFCKMFNDHNDILEILLKENPKIHSKCIKLFGN